MPHQPLHWEVHADALRGSEGAAEAWRMPGSGSGGGGGGSGGGSGGDRGGGRSRDSSDEQNQRFP